MGNSSEPSTSHVWIPDRSFPVKYLGVSIYDDENLGWMVGLDWIQMVGVLGGPGPHSHCKTSGFHEGKHKVI